jgi:glycosyltransferase involved in cell wall biosynthesis
MLPLVTIVTPSFDAGPFLRAAIESVLCQDYPNIEYRVMDGGSTDGTLEILREYEGRLFCLSRPDLGASNAIQQGFIGSRGSILGWLSADDVYAPDAVSLAVREIRDHPDSIAVYGDAAWIDESGGELGRYPTKRFDPALFAKECYICQPACFFRRDSWEQVGGLDQSLRTAYDYDLWIRLSRLGPFRHIERVLAYSRMHGSNKTLSQRKLVFEEAMEVLRRHFGYVPMQWVLGYMAYLEDGRDQFHQFLRPTAGVFLRSLTKGLSLNPENRTRFLRDWLSTMRPDRVLRFLKAYLAANRIRP